MIKRLSITFFLSILFFVRQGVSQEISLNGPWSFAIDPMEKGEVMGWHLPWNDSKKDTTIVGKSDEISLVNGFDEVNVPHTWSTDIRYAHIGKSWYRKGIILPSNPKDKTIRLRFEAVFARCRIFINGNLTAFHEGGYSPFEIDITSKIHYPGINFIAIEVDNALEEYSIPGPRMGNRPQSQLIPWYEYGGITRDVSLIMTNNIYISKQKIEAFPNLETGEAKIRIITWIENKSNSDENVSVLPKIKNRSTGKELSELKFSPNLNVVKPFISGKIVQETIIPAKDVLLWDFDNPNLYDIRTTIVSGNKSEHEFVTYFGIREFKVSGIQVKLNGKPIRVAGGNRHSDHPIYGSSDPANLAKEDMELMRNGNMIFSRLSHTAPSKHLFKWADEHGYLIIAEVPNWQASDVHMGFQKVKDTFSSQLKEMVESIWNCPSVVGYSTGNEYSSWTPIGDEWTRYQMEQYRQLDTTRLLTFVAIGTALNANNLEKAHDSFRYCDLICFNNYSKVEGLEQQILKMNKKYPNKPIFISEVGIRSDMVENEQVRTDHLIEMTKMFNKYPYVVGFSYWSFNDYLSRYPQTNKNGYRPWGIIDFNRKPRDLYKTFQHQLSPITLIVEKNKVIITANSGFPSYSISNHKLKLIEDEKVTKIYDIPEILVGKSLEIIVDKLPKKYNFIVENKGGIVIFSSK